jgi:hypothetical protein
VGILTAVVEGEWEVNKGFLGPSLLTRVVLLDDIVDLTDGGRDEQAEDKGENVPVSGPEEDVDRVEDTEQGESPSDRVDNDLLTPSGELEDHGAEEQ